MGATLAKIGKHVLMAIAGDKKGRKAIGYTIGIALFLIMLPLIAVVGLFGWMSQSSPVDLIDSQIIYEQMPEDYRDKIEKYQQQLGMIEKIFSEQGFSERDISKAKMIYISCLTDLEKQDNFYQNFMACIKEAETTDCLLDKVSDSFGVMFSDADKLLFQNLYRE